jgi:SAM-dependent methyltransferase
MKLDEIVYRRQGFCPICEKSVEFSATSNWYRDYLFCSGCRSIPRERALALVLSSHFPQWRSLSIHESSPANRGISAKIQKECPSYIASQFFPSKTRGDMVGEFRNEDLEQQTFASNSFDLAITLDVMEHINHPDLAVKEIARTLKSGGAYLFTVPTYKGLITSCRRALYKSDGSIEHYFKPEYHGNPVNHSGSLVTFHYGYDFAELIYQWCKMNVEVFRFHDHRHGIIGDFTEVYLLRC